MNLKTDMQRYFLIFSIIFLSYLLLINYNPPQVETTSNGISNDSEYSQSMDYDEFVSREDIVSEELIIVDNTCSTDDLFSFSNKNWKAKINLESGKISYAELTKFPKTSKSDVNKMLFNDCGPERYSQTSGFAFLDKSLNQDALFNLSENYKDGINEVYVFEKKIENLLIKKIISFGPDDYYLKIRDSIQNLNLNEIKLAPFSKIDRSSEVVEAKGSGFTDPSSFAYLGPAFRTSEENYLKISFSDISEKEFKQISNDGWAAMLQHYFLTAVIPDEDENFVFQAKQKNNGDYSIGIVGPTKSLKIDESAIFNHKIYFGPKIQSELTKAHSQLYLAVDYGFLWWIGQPMYQAMNFFFEIVGNWGWAIILVTILIKCILWPLSYVSYKNMGKMRQVQPMLKEIQERYADDRQALSKAMMDLYKREKVNPALGCLPMLLQLPFFLAFYWVLIETVELRYAPFLFWISDLSARDPFFILPILNTLAMWGMQKLQPQPVGTDPIQANVFKYMPFIFGILFAFFPAGLVLYWFINSLVSALQMYLHGPKAQ
ncbi:MAG: membrane protein insertase YidC [Pseudomonadota bacterium]|nr:membrane protein insertase YidC [Pseudomonadota bacterium]